MSADRSFALLITWTTYGTWLPGDRRGYVAGTLQPDDCYAPKVNTPGQPYTANNPTTHHRARTLQKFPTIWLDASQARCVTYALCDAASSETASGGVYPHRPALRGWRILRAAVMANHVHAVVSDCPDDGAQVRRILKGVSQAALSRQAGGTQRWWTESGSNRYLHGIQSIEAAINYVANQERILSEIIDGQVQH